jgi:penicillin-binding protein 2
MKRAALIFWVMIAAACSSSTGSTPTLESSPTLPDPQITTLSAPDAEGAVTIFLNLWNERDFESMYRMLSSQSQSMISEITFRERYEDVWTAAQLTGVDFEIVSSLISPDEAQVRYRIVLKSAILGHISRETWIDLAREGIDWAISWTDSTILPELTEDTHLIMGPVLPTRANVYDREGFALATETDTVALHIVPNQIGDEDAESAMLSALSRLLDRTQESILNLYDDLRDVDWYVHLGEASFAEYEPYRNTLGSVGGVVEDIYPARYYFSGGIAPHTVGYVSWIPDQELETYLGLGYIRDEFVGQIGVEREFEDRLRGVPGGTLYLTDSQGQLLETLASKDSEPPFAVYTNLDRELQRHAQQAIAGFTGAIVVLERDTGAVRAMVSSPGFDPNLFEPLHPYTSRGLDEIFKNTEIPLFDRSTRGKYPLGSVFKIITMAAGMESGLFNRETILDCPLEWFGLPGITLRDWRYDRGLPPQGEITLMQALERSCNTYFYEIGLALYNAGFETAIPDMAKGFGLGSPTGFELFEDAGTVPDSENKLEFDGTEWSSFDSVQLAIGQSYLEVTPLQVARYIAAVGNGGTLYQPQVINRIQSAEGQVLSEFEPIEQGELPISAETLTAIQEAMLLVTSSPDGTARLVLRYPFSFRIQTAGKTGTATTGEGTESHAWFGGYTLENREDKPDIAVVVIVEFQGEGSTWAAPIFRRVVESYFFGEPQSLYRWESRIGVPATPTPTPDPEDDTEATSTP